MELKVRILELLSVCVETQPGLIEIFLNIKPAPATASTDKPATGNTDKVSGSGYVCLDSRKSAVYLRV